MRRSEIVRELLERGYDAQKHDVIKNGVVFRGIVIRGEEAVAPIIYTDEMIADAMEKGMDVSEVADKIILLYEKNRKIDLHVDEFLRRDFILDHIRIGIQKVSEEALVRKTIELEGLEAYLYIKDIGEDKSQCVKLSQGLMDLAGIELEEAWESAEKNSFSETQIRSLSEMLFGVLGQPAFDESPCDIHVVTNADGFRGASAILDRRSLEQFAKKHKAEKLVVLPSSIHEMLVIPYQEEFNLSELDEMVASVNATEVSPEERLADHAYVITV